MSLSSRGGLQKEGTGGGGRGGKERQPSRLCKFMSLFKEKGEGGKREGKQAAAAGLAVRIQVSEEEEAMFLSLKGGKKGYVEKMSSMPVPEKRIQSKKKGKKGRGRP